MESKYIIKLDVGFKVHFNCGLKSIIIKWSHVKIIYTLIRNCLIVLLR